MAKTPSSVAVSEPTLPFGLAEALMIADWKRRVTETYGKVRSAHGERAAWDEWRRARDWLMGSHPRTPLPPDRRSDFTGLSYFDYDQEARVLGAVREVAPSTVLFEMSKGDVQPMTRLAQVTFELYGSSHSLDLFWMESWRGGLFLPFRDNTTKQTTYGGGRYLVDSMKGEDLGVEGDLLVLDFNYAFQPPCAYNPNFSCPLPGPGSRIDADVQAGERLSFERTG
jgi:hypothetical protein